MRKVIIDTNVLVSALISRSYPYLVISDVLSSQNIEWCLSKEIMLEYQAVLRRPKFASFPEFLQRAEQVLASVDSLAKYYLPEIKLDVVLDAADNRFLELAVTAKADFIITGNSNDFLMSKYENTVIVTPREYWEVTNGSGNK